MRCFVSVILAGMLSACGDSYREAGRRDSHRTDRVRSGAHAVGYKTKRTFRKIGGHLQKFFTGHDTITR